MRGLEEPGHRAQPPVLAEQLDVPLRDRNQLLLAAGFAPAYGERPLDAPELQPLRDAIDLVLEGHEPCPAVVVDRGWNVVAANRGVALFTAGAAPELLEPPVNVLRLALHPRGTAGRIANLGEVRAHLLDRLRRHVALTADARLAALYDELAGYPAPAAEHGTSAGEIAIPLRLRPPAGGAELRLFSTIATFGTAMEVTVAELAIEAFFPADAEAAGALREPAR